MVHKTNNQYSYWEIKVSIAKAIAAEREPSVEKLRRDIMEEFGYPPEPELIDVFMKLTGGSAKRVVTDPEDEKRRLAETVALQSAPSVLKFRTEYQKRFTGDPPNELTGYFLKKIQEKGRIRKREGSDVAKFDFVKDKAGESLSILQFRNVFKDTFHEDPSSELLSCFLKKISKAEK